MTVNPDGPDPAYVQMADALRKDIASGHLAPDAKLPSTRMLADQFKVSMMTAVAAIRALREEGLIFTTQRGSFVRGDAAQQAATPSDDLVERLARVEAQMKELTERVSTLESAGNGRHSNNDR